MFLLFGYSLKIYLSLLFQMFSQWCYASGLSTIHQIPMKLKEEITRSVLGEYLLKFIIKSNILMLVRTTMGAKMITAS